MRKTGKIVTCPECGVKKYRPGSQIANGVKYCSRSCALKVRHREGRAVKPKCGADHSQYDSVVLDCPACGKQFTRSRRYVKRHSSKGGPFCSMQCFGTKVDKACEQCGGSYSVQRYRCATARFCSRKCAQTHLAESGGRYIASDGHALDSKFEREVCEILTANGVAHDIHVPLNSRSNQTYDFRLACGSLVEVDGLCERRVVINPASVRSFEGKKAYAQKAGNRLLVITPDMDVRRVLSEFTGLNFK